MIQEKILKVKCKYFIEKVINNYKSWQVIDFRINPEQIGTLSSEKNKFISVTPKRLKKSTGSSSNEILK